MFFIYSFASALPLKLHPCHHQSFRCRHAPLLFSRAHGNESAMCGHNYRWMPT